MPLLPSLPRAHPPVAERSPGQMQLCTADPARYHVQECARLVCSSQAARGQRSQLFPAAASHGTAYWPSSLHPTLHFHTDALVSASCTSFQRRCASRRGGGRAGRSGDPCGRPPCPCFLLVLELHHGRPQGSPPHIHSTPAPTRSIPHPL